MSSTDAWGEEQISTGLVYAKCRIAPSAGTTISKMEVQGYVQATRSLLKVVRALDQQVHRVVLAGDSMCALMSVKREGACFKPYFQNRVGEIRNNLTEVAGLVDVLEESLKVAGSMNPTDICTRGLAMPDDVSEDSTWMKGPDFLSLPRDSWPLCVPDDPSAVPRTELRLKVESAQATGDGQEHVLEQMIERLIRGAGRLTILVGSLARILIAMGSEHEVRRLPEPEDR